MRETQDVLARQGEINEELRAVLDYQKSLLLLQQLKTCITTSGALLIAADDHLSVPL